MNEHNTNSASKCFTNNNSTTEASNIQIKSAHFPNATVNQTKENVNFFQVNAGLDTTNQPFLQQVLTHLQHNAPKQISALVLHFIPMLVITAIPKLWAYVGSDDQKSLEQREAELALKQEQISQALQFVSLQAEKNAADHQELQNRQEMLLLQIEVMHNSKLLKEILTKFNEKQEASKQDITITTQTT